MVIKQKHQHVDSAGIVYLPYITAWNPSSHLLGLVTEMSSKFSLDPPVRATPKNPTPQATPQQSHPTPQQSHPTPQPSNKPFENQAEIILRNATTKVQNKLQTFNKNITHEIETNVAKNSAIESKIAQIEAEIKAIELQKVIFLEITLFSKLKMSKTKNKL